MNGGLVCVGGVLCVGVGVGVQREGGEAEEEGEPGGGRREGRGGRGKGRGGRGKGRGGRGEGERGVEGVIEGADGKKRYVPVNHKIQKIRSGRSVSTKNSKKEDASNGWAGRDGCLDG